MDQDINPELVNLLNKGIEDVEKKIDDVESEIKKRKNDLYTLRFDLNNKIRAKYLYLGEKMPVKKVKKKKKEEVSQ